MPKDKRDGIAISPENSTVISNYITALSEEFKSRFQDLRILRKFLLLAENSWHLKLATKVLDTH